MHRSPAVVLELMDTVAVTGKVSAQPLEPGRIGNIAANAKKVAPTADEIRGVENGLELGDHVAERLVLLRRRPFIVEKMVAKLGPWSCCPSRPAGEVILKEPLESMGLEVSGSPGHRGFDDFVANDQKSVARTGHAVSLRTPGRRPGLHREINPVRSLDQNTFVLEELLEAIELAAGGIHHDARIAVPAE